MDKLVLMKMIEQKMSGYDIARITNKSQTTVRYWLKIHNLKTDGIAKKDKLCELCEKPYIGSNRARFCSKKCKHKTLAKKVGYSAKGVKATKNRAIKRKLLLIKEMGGKCQNSECNYDKNLAALSFHHINPKEKLFEVNVNSFSHYSFEKLKKEAKKCIVLCMRCHQEEHNPLLNGLLNNSSDIIYDENDILFNPNFKKKNANNKFCTDNDMKNNSYKYQKERAIFRKIKLVNMLGGKCKICSYNNNLACLAFHHVNPETKIFNIDFRKCANTAWKDLVNEAQKCEVLCHNCHLETHHPSLDRKNFTGTSFLNIDML